MGQTNTQNQAKHISFHVPGLGRREDRNIRHVLLVVEAWAYSDFKVSENYILSNTEIILSLDCD